MSASQYADHGGRPMRRVEFPQPAPVMSLNDRLHWAAKARWTKLWRETAGWHARAMHRARPEPIVVQIYLPVKDKRRRDPHNFTPTFKAACDGLVDAGVVPDDSEQWVTMLEPVLVPGAATVVIEWWAR